MSRSSRRLAALAVAVAALAAGAHPALAAPGLEPGIFDEAQVLYGNPDVVFPKLKQLHVQIVRVTLYWGGPNGVAKTRPANPLDPNDPAYDWSVYDRTAQYASQFGVTLLLSIYGTPAWANGGRGANYAPTNPLDLRRFANAAAKRYGGKFAGVDGRTLPAVRHWLAWNEPNNPVFLLPQYLNVRGNWVMQSAVNYAKICQAVYNGVHATGLRGELVACGATSPRGNNDPTSARPSVSPLAFMRALKAAGLTQFDAYAHHPYYGSPGEAPATPPRGKGSTPATAVTLGNIQTLIAQLTALWGPKRLWITEYGYQTNPPDPVFGVSPAKQAAYLKQAFAIAVANPRVDMMLWFLLQDEASLAGWQSGLQYASGARKPAYAAYAITAAALTPRTASGRAAPRR